MCFSGWLSSSHGEWFKKNALIVYANAYNICITMHSKRPLCSIFDRIVPSCTPNLAGYMVIQEVSFSTHFVHCMWRGSMEVRTIISSILCMHVESETEKKEKEEQVTGSCWGS